MPLCKWCFKGLVEVGTEGVLRRGRCDARDAEVKDLVEDDIGTVLTGVQRILHGPGFSSVGKSIV